LAGRIECPECKSTDISYDEARDEYICKLCGLVFTPGALSFADKVSIVTVEDEGPGETRVLEKEITGDGGLRLIMTQKQAIKPRKYFNKETGEEEHIHPFWNPITRRMEDRPYQDILIDVSIPGEIWQRYKVLDPYLNRTEAAIVLLGLLGESYPTSALGEAIGVTRYSARRIISTLSGDDYLTKAERRGYYGGTVEYEGEPYREGAINESYRLLTDRGYEYFEDIVSRIVTPYGAKGSEIAEPKVPRPPPPVVPTILSRPGKILVGKGGKMIEREVKAEPMTQEERDWYIGYKKGSGYRRPWLIPREEYQKRRREYFKESRARAARERYAPMGEIYSQYRPARSIVPVEEERALALPAPELREEALKKAREERVEQIAGRAMETVFCTHPSTFTSPEGVEICLICGQKIEK
jgi:hypothetical protein